MAKRIIFKETTKYFNKKHDLVFVQFKDGQVYMTENHIICSMPVEYYNEYILTKIPGFPRFDGENTTYEIRNNRLSFSTVNLADMCKTTGTGKAGNITSMMFEVFKAMARAILWNENGETKGTLVNDIFYKISQEYSDGSYYIHGQNKPVTTGHKNGFYFMMLPIHYTACSLFSEIIDGLNRKSEQEKAA